MGRILSRRSRQIPKFPEPRGRVAQRLVIEMHKLRCLAGQRICVEVDIKVCGDVIRLGHRPGLPTARITDGKTYGIDAGRLIRM